MALFDLNDEGQVKNINSLKLSSSDLIMFSLFYPSHAVWFILIVCYGPEVMSNLLRLVLNYVVVLVLKIKHMRIIFLMITTTKTIQEMVIYISKKSMWNLTMKSKLHFRHNLYVYVLAYL